jgi:hypothetical protein
MQLNDQLHASAISVVWTRRCRKEVYEGDVASSDMTFIPILMEIHYLIQNSLAEDGH